MQLNITTDYAIRLLILLASEKRIVSSKEIADKMGIPRDYILKIVGKLVKENIITTHAGKLGGFTLAVSAKQITLMDVVNIMEHTMHINRCMEADGFCSRNCVKDCPVRDFYYDLQNEIEKKLNSVTIASFINLSG